MGSELNAHDVLNNDVFKALQEFLALDSKNKALLKRLQRVIPAKPTNDLKRMLVNCSTFRGSVIHHSAVITYTNKHSHPDILET